MLTYHCLDTSCRSDIPMVEPPNSLIGSIPIAIQRLLAGMNQFTVTHHLQIAFTGIETIRRIESDIGNKT